MNSVCTPGTNSFLKDTKVLDTALVDTGYTDHFILVNTILLY